MTLITADYDDKVLGVDDFYVITDGIDALPAGEFVVLVQDDTDFIQTALTNDDDSDGAYVIELRRYDDGRAFTRHRLITDDVDWVKACFGAFFGGDDRFDYRLDVWQDITLELKTCLGGFCLSGGRQQWSQGAQTCSEVMDMAAQLTAQGDFIHLYPFDDEQDDEPLGDKSLEIYAGRHGGFDVIVTLYDGDYFYKYSDDVKLIEHYIYEYFNGFAIDVHDGSWADGRGGA